MQKQKSVIITWVLVMGAVFLITLGGFLSLILEIQRSSLERLSWEKSFHIAEAGINYYKWHLQHFPEDIQDGQSWCTKEIEAIRNMPYSDIGTENGYPAGDIPSTKAEASGGFSFTVNTNIDYVADDVDGLSSPDDNCPNDYKRVTVIVSWGTKASEKVSLSTVISPDNELEECEETGGILWANVFDALGQIIDGATVDVKNVNTGLEKQCQTSSVENCYIVLPASDLSGEDYKITVSKDGYSQEETFKEGDTYNTYIISSPKKPNITIIEGETTKNSFSIDKLSTVSIETRSSRGKEEFLDDFDDSSKVSDLFQTVIDNSSGEGEARLGMIDESSYYDSGYIVSQTIVPSVISSWGEFSFSGFQEQNTSIFYQVLYFDGSSWDLIPDVDLPGNESGFTQSPVSLSSLDPTQYSQIRLKANLSTTDTSQTPILYQWSVSYYTKESYLIDNVSFRMWGEKTVGTDTNEDPIYKYDKGLVSGSDGTLTLNSVEWDNYHFSETDTTGMRLVEMFPSQPVPISPDSSETVTLYFEAENNLLVTVKDSDISDPILDALVRVYDSNNYDKTLKTDSRRTIKI